MSYDNFNKVHFPHSPQVKSFTNSEAFLFCIYVIEDYFLAHSSIAAKTGEKLLPKSVNSYSTLGGISL